ncbi:MAG: FAD-binding oxidoreductase [Chloroflexota bacterium]
MNRGSLNAFRRRFGGELVAPADEGYDDARRIWNAMFDRHPALIVRPVDAADVAAAIKFARESDLPIAVRSGGHSASGHSTCDDGLVIDLSAMRGVNIDSDHRTARVNGGALLRELDVAAQAYGLVCPVGVVGHTGVAGLTLGGGFGRLQRRWGLTIDSVRSVELVTADGDLVRSSESEHPDLFWGMRGAGANFGVATSFEFDLHPFDGGLTRGVRLYDARDAVEVWPLVRQFAAIAPDHLSLTMGLGRAEPASDYPESVAGRPIFIVAFNHCGDASTVEADTASLRAGPKPVSESIKQARYLDIQAANDDAMGWGHRFDIMGAFADDLRPATIEALVEHVAGAPPEASFGITVQGGAISRVDDDATAFTGRTASLDVSADAGWDDPTDDKKQIAWIRRAMAIVKPDTVPGRYVNEIADTGLEETRATYGDATYERLAALKRDWDPTNVFRLNHNVEP